MGIFSRSSGRLRLETFASERFPAQAAGEDNWLRQTAAALRALRARMKPAGRVVLVLPPHLTLTKLIRTPRVSPAKRERVVRFEAAQGIPYRLAEVAWDTTVAGEGEAVMDLLLAAAKLEAANALGAAAAEAGFEPAVMLPAPLATLAACRLPPPAAAGPVLALNLGARSAVLVQTDAGRFATRTLAIGGHSVTQQISANQDCEFAEAERLKVSPGQTALLADAVDTLATRLGQEITRTVLHFNRQCGLGRPERILLTGGTARQAGLDEALAARLKLPVARLDALAAVETGHAAAKAGAAAHALELTDLIGAAAGELLPAHPVLNLLPARLRRREGLRRRQPWLVAAAALAVTALLPAILHYRALEEAARSKTVAIEAALAPVREREVRNRAALAELTELRRQVDQLHGVAARRTAWLGLFADLQSRLVQVEDVWLETLQAIPPAAGAPLKLAVSGRMLDKTNPLAKVSPETLSRMQTLLTGLVDSPFVAAVEDERFDNSQPGILRFDIVLVTDPAHPL